MYVHAETYTNRGNRGNNIQTYRHDNCQLNAQTAKWQGRVVLTFTYKYTQTICIDKHRMLDHNLIRIACHVAYHSVGGTS